MARQSPFMSSAQFTYPSGYQQRDARYPASSTVESAMALNRRPSLLAGYHNHFGSPERASLASYYPSLGPVSMGPHVDEHSKRSRYLTSGNLSVNSQLLPLSVDVKKEQQVYQPQTEAISPTPDDPKNDTNIRDSTIIRNAISKLESEIDITMKKLHRAKLSQSEIKSQADRSAADEEDNDDRDDLLRTNGSQTLIEKILHDNRKKAEDSQKMFNHLNNHIDLTIPLYQEANDLESIRRIRIQYLNQMKTRLKDFFKRRNESTVKRTKLQSNQYDQIYQEWQKSIEKEEKTISNKDLSTYRETFEKTFPELRKTREDKEKKQINPSDSSTSEVQVSLNSNPIEGDLEIEGDEKMRKSSVIPPILFDQWQRKHQYFNQNGLIKRDGAEFYKERAKMPYWTAEEKQIFIEKFTQSPKNFGYISSFLENKTTEQCVQFYYMTKKSENYKNLLRKQSQANRKKAKQTTTTTTLTSSTMIETTLVTKVTSSNTIVSSTSQQMIDGDRSTDRLEHDEERREINPTDGNEEKRSNKNRCQLLSCTTEKLGKKKNRKNRLRAFPNKWNELTKENREAIRRSLQIPLNVQRCCTRCYEKLIIQVRQRQTTNPGGEDDDDEDTSKIQSASKEEGNVEWTENEIHAFTQALEKFQDDWTRIAQYVGRSEQSCRAFYQKSRKKGDLADDEQNIDEDNGSISGSEDTTRRLTVPNKAREIDEDNDEDPQKTIMNEDSNDSTHGMVIDEVDEQTSTVEEKKSTLSSLTTINSLVEKEISKTLHQSEKRVLNANISPDKPLPPPPSSSINSTQPPPLVTLTKSRSPPGHSPLNKGSIMRGTPISPSTKPISIDTSTIHSHHYSNPRPDYPSHPSHIKSSKASDQQQLYLQQQQAAYMRHYSQNNFPSQHRPSSNNPQQQPPSANKSLPIDASNNETYETLRADFVTSRYLTTTHSPNHERQARHPSEQRSPSQSSSTNQQLLPPPAVITPTTSNPSHPHHSQQQAVLLAASQMLASSGMYPQELLTSGLLPYSHYYGSLPGASFYVDPRLVHDFTTSASNEQFKNLRSNRHHPHSPPEPSSYSSQSSKRHSLENIEHMRYPASDYATPIWRTQNLNNSQQQIHSQLKSNENSLAKLNELSRHSTRGTAASDRDTRSPDEFHHRVKQSRPTVESPSVHFQRVEALNHHKSSSSSHEIFNPNLHFSDHSSDGNPSSYIRHTSHVHKPQPSHHHHTSTSTNRSSLIPPAQISPHHASAYMLHSLHHSPLGRKSPPHHSSHYSQNRSAHPKESISIQEFMKQSVNDFVASTNNDNKHLNPDSTGTDNSTGQLSRILQPGTRHIDNADQPILIDDNDDSNSMREQNESNTDGNSKNRSNQDVNKLSMDSEIPERRRDSSIKKILSNQPLEKQEYIEINQKVQNSTVGASKVHSSNDVNGLERSNSAGGRETTRSRGSITMRMLMGANGIYVDGKAQPMTTNELSNESSNKRAASPPIDKSTSLEYLIRGELIRACPTLPKNDESSTIFQSRNSSNSLSPTTQQRMSAKRIRASPKDESTSNTEQRPSLSHPSYETSTNARDPFALQPYSKNSHHQSTPSSSNTERNWQSYVQQQYQQSFATRTSRPTMGHSGSITQGSPISPPTRVTIDQQQYPSAANNQLINPRYAHYMNKNESQFSPSRRSPTSPTDHSPKGKFARRAQQTLSSSSSSDTQHESTVTINVDQTSNLKSPSPISLSASPTTSVSSNSAHPLKKRLISEYELEQQRNSPTTQSPTPPSIKTELTEESTSAHPPPPTIPEENTEETSNADTTKETSPNPKEEAEPSS